MLTIPKLSAVMTPFPYSIDLDSRLSEARAMMCEHQVRHLPVTFEGKLAGVVTEHEIDLAVGPDPIPESQDLLVRAVAIPDAYTVDLHEPLDVVLMAMAERHIGSVLVTRKGKLVGIFTSSDACRLLSEHLRTARPPRGDDAA